MEVFTDLNLVNIIIELSRPEDVLYLHQSCKKFWEISWTIYHLTYNSKLFKYFEKKEFTFRCIILHKPILQDALNKYKHNITKLVYGDNKYFNDDILKCLTRLEYLRCGYNTNLQITV
jgi:hypothetical protein